MKLKIIPSPPEYIEGRALQHYRNVAQDLKERQLLYKSDIPIIAAYAHSMAQYEDITIRLLDSSNIQESLIYTDKNKQVRQHPLSRLQRTYLESINTCAKLLGISPYYRTRTKQSKVDQAKSRSLRALGQAL